MLLWHLSATLVFTEKASAMQIYMHMYLPLLFSACIVTAGYVVAWILSGGGIDPGPPNARL
jgi:ABC-type transport system involved in cytochrome bd biosynthesis fused ATPase/permease subunit